MPSSSMTWRVALAAAQATMLPPKVPPMEPGVTLSQISLRLTMAASGRPLAMPLAIVTMSAVTP